MEEQIIKPQRIGKLFGGLLIQAAMFVDGIQILLTVLFGTGLILNSFISIFAGLSFWLIFTLKGVNYIKDGKKLVTMLIQNFGEVIPAFNNVPMFSIGVCLTVLMVWAEDSGDNGRSAKILKSLRLISSPKAPTLESAKSNTLRTGEAARNRQRTRGSFSERGPSDLTSERRDFITTAGPRRSRFENGQVGPATGVRPRRTLEDMGNNFKQTTKKNLIDSIKERSE
jgi:hypothetical protein